MCLNIALCAGDKVCKQDRVPVFVGFTFQWDRQRVIKIISEGKLRRETKEINKLRGKEWRKQEKDNHVREDGQRWPEGWGLRKSQLDERRPGEKRGEQRTQRVQVRDELEEASKWDGEGADGAGQGRSPLGIWGTMGSSCRVLREKWLSYEHWGPL